MSEEIEAKLRRAHRAAASQGGDRAALWVAGAGLVSLALYRALAELGDLRAHLTAYLVIHAALFLIYAGVVVLLARPVFARPPWTVRRAPPALEITTRAGATAPGSAAIVPAAGDAATPATSASATAAKAATAATLATATPATAETAAIPATAATPATMITATAVTPPPRAPGDLGMPRASSVLLATFAVAFRITLLFVPASLSDDIHRYVWDGRVQASGVNPYAHAPDAEALRHLRDAEWSRINHPAVPTIYPPLAEGLFAALGRAGSGEIGYKAVFVVFDLATAWALARLLRRLGRPAALAALYAWNPLVVVEVSSSGHVDPVGLVFLVLAALCIVGERRVLAMVAYSASVLARLLPLAFAPIVIRRFKLPHLLIAAGIIAAGYLPYAGAGGALFRGLGTYAENWDHNAAVFPAVRAALDAVDPVDTLKAGVTHLKSAFGDPPWCETLYRWVYPAPLARALLALALLVGMVVISLDVPEIQRELLCATGLLLVLSPTVHPWYVLWIVPFAAAEVSLPWLLFTGLVPLSYLSLQAADGRVPSRILALEWGAPAVLGIALGMRKRAVARRIRALAARA